jgi:hypothetical protein
MAAWFRSDHYFGGRLGCFHVGLKQSFMERATFAAIEANANDPEKLEAVVMDLILRYRPELKGCALFAMEYNIQRQQWRFSLFHGSLPNVPPGQEINARPLDPAYERDLEATARIAEALP